MVANFRLILLIFYGIRISLVLISNIDFYENAKTKNISVIKCIALFCPLLFLCRLVSW